MIARSSRRHSEVTSPILMQCIYAKMLEDIKCKKESRRGGTTMFLKYKPRMRRFLFAKLAVEEMVSEPHVQCIHSIDHSLVPIH